jgi:hypothetical protein
MPKLTRKEFLRLAAAGVGTLVGGPFLSACAPAPTPAPTPLPSPTSPPAVAPTLTPAVSVPTLRRPDVIKIGLAGKSAVVHTHHAGVWDGDKLLPAVLNQMLDASITKLTGLNDAKEAWLSVFQPNERIALKVNSITTGVTHPAIVLAVADRLQAAGIPSENIYIFDRYAYELKWAGYQMNLDGPGARCVATGSSNYTGGWKLLGNNIRLSNVLLSCDAVINLPVLKIAGQFGISFALKNHFGTFDRPYDYHTPFARALPQLNAIPAIRDRARLAIGDLFTVKPVADGLGFRMVGTGDSILMSFDPVAHDAVGVQVASDVWSKQGRNPAAMLDSARRWLGACTTLGLGAHQPEAINMIDVKLT